MDIGWNWCPSLLTGEESLDKALIKMISGINKNSCNVYFLIFVFLFISIFWTLQEINQEQLEKGHHASL